MKPVWYVIKREKTKTKQKKNKHMKFTNKEEYLAYRTQWKADYNKLSQEIRNYKRTWKHQELKAKATAMLQQLKFAKIEAQRQYLAAKALREQAVVV